MAFKRVTAATPVFISFQEAIQSAHPAGIEPATIGLEDRCSIH